MLRQYRKADASSDAVAHGAGEIIDSRLQDVSLRSFISLYLIDYIKFVVYCLLLVVPIYAIVISVLHHNWVMVAIDVLIVPLGFVHGLLLLFGIVT